MTTLIKILPPPQQFLYAIKNKRKHWSVSLEIVYFRCTKYYCLKEIAFAAMLKKISRCHHCSFLSFSFLIFFFFLTKLTLKVVPDLIKFFSNTLSKAGSSSSRMSSMRRGRPKERLSSKCVRKYLWFRDVT